VLRRTYLAVHNRRRTAPEQLPDALEG
jgi:hypothetical protein